MNTDRHKQRHREKDDEAGGEGLGRLLTRKRLWKDPNGVIVAKKRPEHEKKRKSSTISSSGYGAGSSLTSQPLNHQQSKGDADANGTPSPFQFHSAGGEGGGGGGHLLSPPGSSDPTSETLDQFGSEVVGSSENGLSAIIDNDAWPLPGGEMAMQDFSVDSYEFLNNASWGTPSCPQDVGADLLFDNIFAPDTGEFSRLCT